MKEINLETWTAFEEQVHALEVERRRKCDEKPGITISALLYRGHADARWRLETTLERHVKPTVTLRRYYRLICAIQPKVETFTNQRWEIPSFEKYEQWLEKQDHLFFFDWPGYPYFVYLRHHGFPSPLLDWSASPYVAAFFAMNRVPTDAENVSIYVFWERVTGAKGASSRTPQIHELGPYVRAHARHFTQQSRYTICTQYGDAISYANHEAVTSQEQEDQDLLWKFNLPVSERLNVLRALNKMNINPFSLFATEESLMETIAIEELLLRERPALP